MKNTVPYLKFNNRRARIAVLAPVILFGVLLGAGQAHATSTPITLGTAAGYAMFTGTSETSNINGGLNVTGTVGWADKFKVALSGTNSISGHVYYDNSSGLASYSQTGTLTQPQSSISTSLTQAVADAVSASANAGQLAQTAGLTDQGGSITSSVTINALTTLSENVLDVSSVNLTNGTITFNDNGNTGAKYVVNVVGNFSLSNTNIVLAGGATAADIIWNIEGTGATVSITGGTTYGTFLVPQSNVTIGGGGSLTGELIAGANSLGKGYTLTEQSSGYNITSFAYVPRTVSKVPEPSSIALLGTGIFAVAAFTRRRKKH